MIESANTTELLTITVDETTTYEAAQLLPDLDLPQLGKPYAETLTRLTALLVWAPPKDPDTRRHVLNRLRRELV
jgi:hypothetical protein